MSETSLLGLANLTKGAYFEQLVADKTGGELFAHFNHPDTDIMIDGIAYQIKATENVAYIESVAEGIPVITTTEVAAVTGSIDSGFSHAEISSDIELAFQGGFIDTADSVADGILASIGGLGVFATLKGLKHAASTYSKDRDLDDAIGEGLEIALIGTAKATVDLAEFAYKAAMSRPSRFLGRCLLKTLKKIDDKLCE